MNKNEINMTTKKRIIFTGILSFLLLTNCSNTEANPYDHSEKQKDMTTETTPKKDSPEVKQVENQLKVEYQTKLVEWGGDGRWHEMSEMESGVYWVNYLDPFKFKLSGTYPNLSVKVKSSNGETIYNKSGIAISEPGSFEITNPKFIGENEITYFLEISDGSKIIYTCRVESVPGGE